MVERPGFTTYALRLVDSLFFASSTQRENLKGQRLYPTAFIGQIRQQFG